MTERFVLDRTTAELVGLFDVDTYGDVLPEPSSTIVPPRSISIVLDSLPKATEDEPYPEPLRRLEAARWGLVPGWAKAVNSGPPLSLASSEGVASQPAFQNAVMKRRAVVPASAYYEWKVVDGARVPCLMSLPGEELLVFAALYEWWRNPVAADGAADRWLLSTTILTCASAGAVSQVSDRMPVLLDADLVEGWLDPQEEGSQDLVDELVGAAGEIADRVQCDEVRPDRVAAAQSGG